MQGLLLNEGVKLDFIGRMSLKPLGLFVPSFFYREISIVTFRAFFLCSWNEWFKNGTSLNSTQPKHPTPTKVLLELGKIDFPFTRAPLYIRI